MISGRYNPNLMAVNFFIGATTENLGPGVLYQVKASYKYQAEDVDELNFEVGEVVDVVEYDDPEEQVCSNIILWISNHDELIKLIFL